LEKTKMLVWFHKGNTPQVIAERLQRNVKSVRKVITANKDLQVQATPPRAKKRSGYSVYCSKVCVVCVPDRKTGSCLDPKLQGNGLQEGEKKGPGLPSHSKKSQLRPCRDGETMRGDKEESIPDAMKEDQRPTE
jgi:hypothetical protein